MADTVQLKYIAVGVMRSISTAIICAALTFGLVGSACASGEWFWLVNPNPVTGTPHYSGVSGSATPLTLMGTVYNTDSANTLIFDGITLKTDELAPNDLSMFDKLWVTNTAVEVPQAFTVAGGNIYNFALGQFDLSSAAPGTYKFKFTAAVEYDSVSANPDQTDSGFVTIDVLPVPEPASALALIISVVGIVLMKRKPVR